MLSLEDDSQSKPTESQASTGNQQQTQQGDDPCQLNYLELMIDNIIQDQSYNMDGCVIKVFYYRNHN